MIKHAGLLSLLSCLLLLTGCDSQSGNDCNYSATIDEGWTAVQEVMEQTGAASVSVALVNGERVIWSEAFGVADREADWDATVDTLFPVCSISKIIAAVAVMILVDQEDVSLDEPVTKYVPDFYMPLDERYRYITVRMLLNHSSGLPGYDIKNVTLSPFPEYAARMLDGLTLQRLLYEPGAISSYNNEGFTMLENLVKAVTGEDYTEFVRQRILEPLGMGTSRFQDVSLPDGSCARAYKGENLRPIYSLNVYASGGLYSTSEEMARMAMMLMNGGMYGADRILSAESVSAMARDQRAGSFNPVPCEEYRYGLGWDTVTQPGLGATGVTAWQKNGDLAGMYGSVMVVVPEEKLGVVVLGASGAAATSFGSYHATKIANRILLRALVERGRISGMPEPLSSDPLPYETVTWEEKSTYSGVYASSSGICRLHFGADDSLSLEMFDSDWTSLYENFKLRNDGWYAADNDPTTALRLLTRSGRHYFALRQKGASDHYSYSAMMGQGLEDRPPLSGVWETRLNETWLPVNEELDSDFPVDKIEPGFQLRTVSSLTGYLLGNKILADMAPADDDRLDGKFLIVPDGVRGMEDVAIETWNNQEWLRVGSYLYRPLSGVPLLDEGATTISIGNDGFAEWFRLPSTGSLTIDGSDFWGIYDREVTRIDSGDAYGDFSLNGDAVYLVLCGEPGEKIVLNLIAW